MGKGAGSFRNMHKKPDHGGRERNQYYSCITHAFIRMCSLFSLPGNQDDYCRDILRFETSEFSGE